MNRTKLVLISILFLFACSPSLIEPNKSTKEENIFNPIPIYPIPLTPIDSITRTDSSGFNPINCGFFCIR